MELHPQLLNDTHRIGRLPLSHCLLMDDARYPWIILVPELDHPAREIYQLDALQRQQLLEESCLIQQLLNEQFDPKKLNVGALGNIVPQLHLHHIARNEDDPAWPGPVWGHSERLPYTEEMAESRIQLFQKLLQKKLQ